MKIKIQKEGNLCKIQIDALHISLDFNEDNDVNLEFNVSEKFEEEDDDEPEDYIEIDVYPGDTLKSIAKRIPDDYKFTEGSQMRYYEFKDHLYQNIPMNILSVLESEMGVRFVKRQGPKPLTIEIPIDVKTISGLHSYLKENKALPDEVHAYLFRKQFAKLWSVKDLSKMNNLTEEFYYTKY